MTTRRMVSFFLALMLFASGIYALSDADIRALKITAQGDTFFVGKEVTYTLTLAGVDPSLTYTELPDFSAAGARFVSSKKEELYDVNGSGTRFSFQIAFTAAGVADLPPLTVYINRRAYTVPFARVTVYEDPATVVPQIFVVFDDARWQQAAVSQPIAVEVGEPIGFTLYAQYCRQLLHVSWELPKNALFTETERFAIARGEVQQTAFSPDRVPVAHFVWTPLVAGAYDFPSFAIEAVAYNGARKNPAVPAYQIVVRAETDNSDSDRASGTAQGGASSFFASDTQRGTLFADAFQPVQTEIASTQTSFAQTAQAETAPSRNAADAATQAYSTSAVTREQWAHLASLRAAERNALPFSRARAERKQFEARCGITDSPNEPSKTLFRALLVLAVASAVLCALLFSIRKRHGAGVALVGAVVFLAAGLWSFARLSRQYALFAGGAVSPVPEKNASSAVAVSGGVRVRIVQTAGDWSFIESEAAQGWVQNDALFLID